MTPLELLILYLLFRLKQYVCDFLLQNSWMANGKGQELAEAVRPLMAHTIIHGFGTTIVVCLVNPSLWWLGLLDLVVHTVIDRGKAVLTRSMGWTDKDKFYWWTFGLDQEAHNLTHLAYVIYMLYVAGGLDCSGGLF